MYEPTGESLAMSTTLSMGDFSLMTHLSAKTLPTTIRLDCLNRLKLTHTRDIAIITWNNSRQHKLFSGSGI
jgi:hypothetical protein